jgi:hypothetical protein
VTRWMKDKIKSEKSELNSSNIISDWQTKQKHNSSGFSYS